MRVADALKPTEELRQRSLPPKEQRSLLPAQTLALPVVRNHRRWLSRDIDRLLTKAWDPSLSVDELQAVNEELNRAAKRKAEWDARLVELGGVLEDLGGVAGAASAGYQYYGRAKSLLGPNAGEHNDDENGGSSAGQKTRQRQGHMYQLVNAEYYGFDHDYMDGQALSSSTTAVPYVPSRQEIESAILNAKKSALLSQLNSLY